MKRLHLTVEGQTEAAFATGVLQPHLANFNVFLGRPRFTGPSRRRGGRFPRGGLLNTFQRTFNDIRDWLKEDQSSDARFSMMVDLYALPHDFPGYGEGIMKPSGREQAEFLEQSLSERIGDARFLPFLQVHEFEALVLADPLKIAEVYEVRRSVLEELRSQCSKYESPEDINHGQHSHPKSRIRQIIPEYDENIAGPLLTESIGLPLLRNCCHHFGRWLTQLEQLDQSSL